MDANSEAQVQEPGSEADLPPQLLPAGPSQAQHRYVRRWFQCGALVWTAAAAALLLRVVPGPAVQDSNLDSSAGVASISGVELDELVGALEAKFGVTTDEYEVLPRHVGKAAAGTSEGGRPGKLLDFLFWKADEDESGFIDGDELDLLKSSFKAKFALTTAKYAEEHKKADHDRDGRLNREECASLYSALTKGANDFRMRSLFNLADKDKDSIIRDEEFEFVQRACEKRFGVEGEAYMKFVAAADANSDGGLDLQEFTDMTIALKKGSSSQSGPPLMKTIVFFFNVADRDKSGFIEGRERETVDVALQRKFGLETESYLDFVARSDLDGDQRLDLRDLSHLCLALLGDATPHAEVDDLLQLLQSQRAPSSRVTDRE